MLNTYCVKGSKDLGSHTLEGSRSGMAMLVYLPCISSAALAARAAIVQSINKARYFADLIKEQSDFELNCPARAVPTDVSLPSWISKSRLVKMALSNVLNWILTQWTHEIYSRRNSVKPVNLLSPELANPGLGASTDYCFPRCIGEPFLNYWILTSVLEEQREIAESWRQAWWANQQTGYANQRIVIQF